MNKIAIIGGGNMGSAYAEAFVNEGFVNKEGLLIIEKNVELQTKLNGLGTVKGVIDPHISECGVIILAVKPQDSLAVCQELKTFLQPIQLVISIMAGVSLSILEERLSHANIVRAMPNMPAQIGKGITAFVASKGLEEPLLEKAKALLEATGKAVLLEKESLMDGVTALSGSGPAYFFYILEAMINAGIEMGLEENVAKVLAKETMNGSFHLLNNSNKPLTELIASVTSKGGTTEAALKVFAENDLGETIKKGIYAAEKRSKELAKG